MQEKSTLFEVGGILILVGAILSAFGAVFMILLAGGMSAAASATDNELPAWFPVIYGGLGLVLAAGSVTGFMGFKAARAGDARRAGVLGIVSACLPPLQAVTLAGGICCYMSDEAKAQAP